MKKMTMALSALFLGVSTATSAHSLWTVGKNADVFEADLIYGHHFPQPEKIATKRLSLFDPIKVLNQKGEITLQQNGENYHYTHSSKLGNGTHIILANYKPTYWTEKSDGKWEMGKTRQDFPDAKHCGQYAMQAKSFVVINDQGDFATKPTGKGYEITPMISPVLIKSGEQVKFKATYNGEPLKSVMIVGSPAGFDPNDTGMNAFSAKTNSNGEFSFKALTSGLWYLSGKVEQVHSNTQICDKNATEFTLSFDVK